MCSVEWAHIDRESDINITLDESYCHIYCFMAANFHSSWPIITQVQYCAKV